MDAGLDACAAGALHVDAGRVERQARAHDRFAGQVPVLGMFDDRAERDVAERLALEIVFLYEGLQGRRHHVLVGAIGVDGVRAAERDPDAADDGHSPRFAVMQHRTLRQSGRIFTNCCALA